MSDRLRPRLRWLMMAILWGLMLLLLVTCGGSEVKLTSSISPEPIVGRDVNYHVEVWSAGVVLPNVHLTITLPSGVELVTGDLYWNGDIDKDQKVIKDLTIRVTAPGERVVKAYADTAMGGKGLYFSSIQSLYLTSSPDSAEVVDALQKTPTPCASYRDCGGPPGPATPTVILRKP